MQQVQSYFTNFREFLDITILKLGETSVTLWILLYLLFWFVLLLFITAKMKKWIVERLLKKASVEVGVRQSIATIARYLIISVGIIVLLQTAGIDLSALTVLAGALGIGIGFGLQTITTNFVSGLIILLERPVKIGDRIEVENTAGNVINISARATTILTNDNIAVIVPNSEFVTGKVINWSYTNRDVRFKIPVGVSYGSDPELVKRLLMDVAIQHSGVLKEPKPDVLFDEFGDSSLNFLLRVWTRTYTTTPRVLKSDLYFSIFEKFRENNVEIPFPQRDLHLKSFPPALRFPEQVEKAEK